jgi:hypothetical protein
MESKFMGLLELESLARRISHDAATVRSRFVLETPAAQRKITRCTKAAQSLLLNDYARVSNSVVEVRPSHSRTRLLHLALTMGGFVTTQRIGFTLASTSREQGALGAILQTRALLNFVSARADTSPSDHASATDKYNTVSDVAWRVQKHNYGLR